MKTKKIIVLLSTSILIGCSSQNVPSSTNHQSSTSVTIDSTPTEMVEETPNEIRSYGMTKLISLVVPKDWEIMPDGYDSAYIQESTDSIEIRKGEADIRIIASLESYPIGIGGDPYTEGNYTYGDYSYEAIRTSADDLKQLSLEGGGYLGYIFDDYGILSVEYTNPNGAYADDADLIEILNSLHVKDSYGTITILADKINIRSDTNTDAEKRGIVQKGEMYKVRAIQEDENYTWYAIGYTQGDPNGGSFDWIADKDGKWIEFKES